MLSDLEGKNVLITGGAKRVGREIGLTLARKGAGVAFTYRSSRKEALQTAEDVAALGGPAWPFQADLTSLDSCDRLIEEVTDKLGHIDVLVNSASNFPRTPLKELQQDRVRFEESWDSLTNLHMRAPLYLGLQLGLRMKARGWGRIINITDRLVARSQSYRHWAIYIVSKYGLHGVTQVLANELLPEVTVNSIAPGLVIPPERLSEKEGEELREQVPLRKQAGPPEIAADVLHLILSEFKTGMILLTDGGAGMVAE